MHDTSAKQNDMSAAADHAAHASHAQHRLVHAPAFTALILMLFASASTLHATPTKVPVPVPWSDSTPPAMRPDASLVDPDSPDALDDWSFIPVVFYTPETSVGFGAAVIHSFNPSTSGLAQLSTLAVGLIATTEGQVVVRVEPDIRFDDVLMQGVLRFQRYPTHFFPDGGHPGDDGERFDELAFITHMDIRYRLGAPDTALVDLAGGLRCDVRWGDVTDTVPDGLLASADPLGLDPFVAAGCGPILAYDTRDDVRSPSSGLYAQARLAGFFALYGDSFTALLADLDLRAYVDLGNRHVLASQFALRSTLGTLPFQMTPRLGGSTQHRGWFEGHLRDQSTLLLQLEWRFPLVWKFGATVFASAGQAFDRFDAISADSLRFAAGAGLRFFLNERQKVNLRLDVAWGSGLAVYVDVLEAF